ncbi:MAG TPA: ATP-binding protein [bacterium]|nr:ATP-binding protein [bacterium]HPT29333.1 ATP-binding protein [bacterium]
MQSINLAFIESFLITSMVVVFLLGLIVLLKGKKATINRLFFFVAFVCALWEFCTLMMFNSPDEAGIMFWDRLVYAGVVFFPAVEYHFSCAVTYYNRQRRWILALGYLLSVFFLYLTWTPYLVDKVYYYRWGVHTQAQIGHHFFFAFFILYVVAFLFNFIKQYRITTVKVDKSRLTYYLVAFTILNVLGGAGFLPAYKIFVYPIFLIAPLIFSILITYAIILHGLMNIKLILRRSLVYFFSFISILIPAFIWQFFFYRFFPQYTMVSYIAIFVLSMSIFSGLKKYYFRVANRYFFSSLYDVRDLISDLNSELRSSLDTGRIFSGVSQILSKAFHSKSIGVISYNKRRDLWNVIHNSGFLFDNQQEISLNYEILEIIFNNRSKPVIVREIKEGPWHQFFSMVKFFDNLGVEVVVPVVIKGKLNSLMLFGFKESNDSYNQEDLKVLEVVSEEVAISMENAALYQRTKQFNVELKDKIDKATKQLQEQNVELQKVNKIKNDFISVTSHQLKTPLATTKLNLEIFGLKFKKDLKPEATEMIDNLNNVNNQLINLVEELLDVARIEDSRLKIDIEPLDVATMISATVLGFKPLADRRQIKIVENAEAVPTINFDRSILSKAISNLISNGIKYNRDQKNLTINVKKSDLGVLIAVSDEGIGIPQAEQPKIFQKFYQATNAAKANFESSTGLGMYITKSSIEQLGGRVWFESKENEGSTFFLDLPLKATIKQ